MIDRSLNYGRHLIKRYLQKSMPYKCVLDIGAGGGNDLMIARQVNGTAKLFAVEIDDKNITKLKSLGTEVYVANIERDDIPFRNETMDVVIANRILEHNKEVFWIFHEITRVLPVGGKLILGVPNLASLYNRLLLLLGRQPSSTKTASAHIRGFTKHDVMHFLNECFPGGYQLRGFGGSNFYPFPPILAKPLAKLFPNASWSIFLMLEKVQNYDQQFLEYPIQHQLETNFWIGQAVHEKGKNENSIRL